MSAPEQRAPDRAATKTIFRLVRRQRKRSALDSKTSCSSARGRVSVPASVGCCSCRRFKALGQPSSALGRLQPCWPLTKDQLPQRWGVSGPPFTLPMGFTAGGCHVLFPSKDWTRAHDGDILRRPSTNKDDQNDTSLLVFSTGQSEHCQRTSYIHSKQIMRDPACRYKLDKRTENKLIQHPKHLCSLFGAECGNITCVPTRHRAV